MVFRTFVLRNWHLVKFDVSAQTLQLHLLAVTV